MSRPLHIRFLASPALSFGLMIMSAAAPAFARAQAAASHLRAVAVYEYVGEMKSPAQSRLVPICIWDGTQFQPAGLYLADPEPLAVEAGTLYELMEDGIGVGQVEVNQAEQIASGWIGLGHYLPNPKPQHAKLKLPSYLTEAKSFESDAPHFAYTPPKSTGVAGSAAPNSTSASEGRPTLHSRETPAEEARPTLHSDESEPPSLHPPGLTTPGNVNLDARSAPPDRPRLFFGKPKTAASEEKQEVLTGLPAKMEQIVAVSDPEGANNHSYAWSWSSSAEEAEAKATMENLARKLLTRSPSAPANMPSGARHKALYASLPATMALAGEHFQAFQLSWGSGAVYVFSARADVPQERTEYITLIARPDFNGSLVTLYEQITPAALLDYQPRLRLIDAVDATGDGHADLLFDLLTRQGRQFALFQVEATEAQQVFTTAPH